MKSVEESIAEVSSYNEICTYFIINEIGGFIWRMNHDMADGRIESSDHAAIDKDIVTMREIQLHAVKCLTKFGVTPFKDDEKTTTAEYWAWFRWWDAYIKNMPKEQWEELDELISTKKDVSAYRPEGNWKDNVEKEEENIKKSQEFWSKVGEKV